MKEITIKNTDEIQTIEEKLEVIRMKINEIVKFCNEKQTRTRTEDKIFC